MDAEAQKLAVEKAPEILRVLLSDWWFRCIATVILLALAWWLLKVKRAKEDDSAQYPKHLEALVASLTLEKKMLEQKLHDCRERYSESRIENTKLSSDVKQLRAQLRNQKKGVK